MSLTWLHVSDFHVRGGDPYDRDVVLRALVAAVRDYRARGHAPDLIFATGDIAHAGKPPEYEIATRFFDDLLGAAHLDRGRLFVVPGNHDVDRELGIGLARTLENGEQADSYFRPDLPKPHVTFKLRAFLDWHHRYFAGVRAAIESSTCGPVERIELNGHVLGILPLNTALFCQDESDHGKLWIGRRCLDSALAQLREVKAGLNLALAHHPLEWLSEWEGANIRSALESSVDILLRGHLHEADIRTVASVDGALLSCAAGAAYQTRRWPNRALYATFDGTGISIFPIRYEDQPREIWTTDPSVFPRDTDHTRRFPVPRLAGAPVEPPAPARREPPPPVRFRSNIPSRGNRPFVGRQDVLADMLEVLADPARDCVLVLRGQPGVGKSEIAREFARRHRDRYPGGTFFVDASTDAIAIELARIGTVNLDLDFPRDLPLEHQGEKTFYSFAAEPVLLIYDNVRSVESVTPWLPRAGMPCHIVITTLMERGDAGWRCLDIDPLSAEASVLLVKALAGDEIGGRYGATIAEQAAGLPIQIVPAAATLALEQSRGRLGAVKLTLAREAAVSFRAAWDRLDEPARLLLGAAAFLNPQRIPREELVRCLTGGLGWSRPDVERALDTCFDLHLLDGTVELRVHQLFASFVNDQAFASRGPSPPDTGDGARLAGIRSAQRQRFVELAASLERDPADAGIAAAMMSYPLVPVAWERAGESLGVDEVETVGRALCGVGRFDEALAWFHDAVSAREQPDASGRVDHASLGRSQHQVGYCLSSTGRSEEARPWFERAVAEAEQGDVDGRIDHESLGRSQHQVGYCLSSTDRYEEARPWFERAIAAKERGHVHGRIDHESLGASQHQVGYCLSSTGRYEDARPWFERAVAAKERGDEDGRIDHESLGASQHQVGYCLSGTGRYEDARPWFERAVAAKEHGDVHGRIDHESLGRSLEQVGYCLSSAGRHGEARSWFERAVAAKEQGDVHGRVQRGSVAASLRALAECHRCLGEPAQAAACDLRASELGT